MVLDTNDEDNEEVYFTLPSSISQSQKRKKVAKSQSKTKPKPNQKRDKRELALGLSLKSHGPLPPYRINIQYENTENERNTCFCSSLTFQDEYCDR